MPVESTENEIRVRVIDPGRFQSDSFRRIALSASQGIFAIIGKLKGKDKTTVQALRFLKSKGWDETKAVAWARAHGYKPKEYDAGEEITPTGFEEDMWKDWDVVKELDPKEVYFKLMGPIESFKREYSSEDEKEISEEKGFRISGHANVAADDKGEPYVDRDNELVEWQALASSITEYMKNPVLRFMHRIPVGVVLDAHMDEIGLVIDARIGRNYKDITTDIEDGIYSSFSIGFKANAINEYCPREGECVRAFTDIELLEVSIVDIPANAMSRFAPTKVYITGTDYTADDGSGKNYLKWVPSLPPVVNSITITTVDTEAEIPCGCGGENNEKTPKVLKMPEDEKEQLSKQLAESQERLKVYQEKERLAAEEKAFKDKVHSEVETALAGKLPSNLVTADMMKSQFESFLASQQGQRQSFAAPGGQGSTIKTREEAFAYLGEKYFSKMKVAGGKPYTKGDIEFEMWLERQCIEHGKIRLPEGMSHTVQKAGGSMDPRFREAYDTIMKINPDQYTVGSTPLGGNAAGTGLSFMPEGWADEIIELVYEQSWFRQMVGSMVMNEYKVHIPKLTGTMDYYQWTRSATEGSSDVAASAPTTGEIVLEIKTLLGSVPIGNAVIAYGVAGLGPGIKSEMAKRLNWVELHSFINGDVETGGSYANNINGAWNGTTNVRGVDATHNTFKLMYDGIRRHNFDAVEAGEVANVSASGAAISALHIRKALNSLGVYGDMKEDLVLLVPKTCEATILGWDIIQTIDKYGPAATIHTGEIGKLYGITVISSSVVPENLNASGKFDGSTTNLTVAVLFDRSSPIIGNPGPASRKFSITFDDEPKRDRFSLLPREDVAFNVRRRDAIVQIYNLSTVVT
jgi:HK97 family phage prohead protease